MRAQARHSHPCARDVDRSGLFPRVSPRRARLRARAPQLNGKVERSHRTDTDEFYQLLTYRDDVDLNKKLAVWERFYNYDRPHGAHSGRTPYEALREKLR
jgi:transposase InsO family protein